jgi:GntR family transcriptional repressor for pyruvate dehydrogenase complex
MTASLARTSLPEQVFRRLCGDVLAGRYAPGERLPTQRALAAELGVNLASVREGVKRLEQLNLVDVRHGDAMRVRDWRAHAGPDVLVHALAAGAALDAEVLRAVLEARRLLLSESARMAAARRSPGQASLLASLAEDIGGAQDDEAAQRLDFAWFAVLVEAAGNVVFLLVFNSIRALYLERLDLFRAIVGDRGELVEDYRLAARAIAQGDGEVAAAAVARLAAGQERRLLEALP